MAEVHAHRRETWWAIWGAVLTSAVIMGSLAWASIRITGDKAQAMAESRTRVAGERQEMPSPAAVPESAALDPTALTADPEPYRGQSGELSGSVAELLSDGGFRLEAEGQSILVRLAAPRADLVEGQAVRVIGTVRGREELESTASQRRDNAAISDAFLRAMAEQPVYLEATQVDVLGEAPASAATTGG